MAYQWGYVNPMSSTDPFESESKQLADRKAAAKLASINDAEDLRWLMSNKRGRRIVWRWLEKAGVYRSSFNHSGSVTSFNEGMRNIGLMLLSEIHECCPEHYLTMIMEQKND